MKNTDSNDTKIYIHGEIYKVDDKGYPYHVSLTTRDGNSETSLNQCYEDALNFCRSNCESYKSFVDTEEVKADGKETMSTMPSHYHPGMTFTETAQIQEYVNNNILKSGQYDDETRNRIALWAGMALKHLLRLGLKDDMLVEIRKSENYCHRAIEGEWINDR